VLCHVHYCSLYARSPYRYRHFQSNCTACTTLRRTSIFVSGSVRDMCNKHQWTKLPKFLIGVSSGGSFLSSFFSENLHKEHNLHFAALALYITPTSAISQVQYFPPTVFVTMPKDNPGNRADAVSRLLPEFQLHGIPVEVHECSEFLFSPDFITSRTNQVTPKLAAWLVSYLQDVGKIDNSFKFKFNPRNIDFAWDHEYRRQALEEKYSNPDIAIACLSELMNVAWAGHEMTQEFADDVIAFFVKQIV
jgi:hypothetical protein